MAAVSNQNEWRSRKVAASSIDESEYLQEKEDIQESRRYPRVSRPGQPDSEYLAPSLAWVFSVIATVLRTLKFPIALFISFRLFVFSLYYVADAVLPAVCENLVVSYFDPDFCQGPSPPVDLNDIVTRGLQYTSTFDEIQSIWAKSNDIPKQLRQEEGNIRDLIIELSSIDGSLRQKYQPLLQPYSDLIDANIASQINLKATLGSTIDSAYAITSWATRKMESIKEEESSPLLIAAKAMKVTTGISLISTSNMEEVQNIFFGVTDRFVPYIDAALKDADSSFELLSRFRGLLVELAFTSNLDKEYFSEEKLAQASFWKQIFRSHRDKIRDFDKKMDRCSRLFTEATSALQVADRTKDKVLEVRAGFSVFRNDVKDASMGTMKGVVVPFDLLIDHFKTSSEALARVRDRVHQIDGGNSRVNPRISS